MIGALPVERSKGSHASPASRRRHRAVDNIPSFHIRCPGVQLQTACAPWTGWGLDCFTHQALSGAATRVRDCSWDVHRLGHPHGHSGHCRSEKLPVHTLLSSPSVNLVGSLQPHLRVSQFVADPILNTPAPSAQASSKSRVATGSHLSSSLGIAREIWHVPN